MNTTSVYPWMLMMALLVSCSRSPQTYFGTVVPKHPPDSLWLNNGSEPEWIDPGKCSDSTGGEVIDNIFSGLIQAHPKTLQPMPEMAESWDISADGRTYIFHLRPSVWSDGTPLTAEDFVWSWKRILQPDTAARYASMLYVFKNAEAYHKKLLEKVPESQAPKVGIEALDAQTLKVELNDPIPYFLNLMAFHTFRPVPRHVLERLHAQGLHTDLWTRPEHIVSSGPYILSSWRFKNDFTYEQNPRYWDAQSVRIKHVKTMEVESANTALNLYRTGELDGLGSSPVPSEFIERLQSYKDYRHDPNLSVYYFWLNTQVPPLDKLEVRQALSLAVDRESLVKYITRGGQIPTADLVPDGLAGYRGLKTPLFDPKRARKLLEDAGYPAGKGLKPITLIYNTSEGHKQIAEAVQAMWKEHLGVDIQLENQEWKVFLKNLDMHNFQMARMGWIGDYPDPNTFLHDILTSDAGNNLSGWADKRYDAMLDEANRILDPEQRMDMLRQAEAFAMKAQPLIPVYIYTRTTLVKPYVRGFWGNYLDRHPIKYMWIDPRWYDSIPTEEPVDPPPSLPHRG